MYNHITCTRTKPYMCISPLRESPSWLTPPPTCHMLASKLYKHAALFVSTIELASYSHSGLSKIQSPPPGMDAAMATTSGGGIVGVVGEEAARLWAELPVRVEWAAVAAQCEAVAAHARRFVLVPAVKLLVFLSLAMTVMILVEKLFVCAVCLAVKAFRLKPERRYRWEPIAASSSSEDEEAGNGNGGGGGAVHPMVLVQIPMYNEREVYKLSIGAACALEWPSDRFVVQVLDDSTDPVVKID
ncbi:hypothetical protein ACP70R_000741 [Stipagrostis hirtigluma subsp. patula]